MCSAVPPCGFGFVIFFVESAARGCHPLDIAGFDDAGVTLIVAVRYFSFEYERDRFESAVRMRTDADFSVCSL